VLVMQDEKVEWRRLKDAPPEILDGRDVIVAVDIATVWVVRLAWWRDGEFWEEQKFTSQEEARGWWSYIHSVTQEKLEGMFEPTHYLSGAPKLPDN
jgi:hypothetical protein